MLQLGVAVWEAEALSDGDSDCDGVEVMDVLCVDVTVSDCVWLLVEVLDLVSDSLGVPDSLGEREAVDVAL